MMNGNGTGKNKDFELLTKNKYPLPVIRSWIQKSIRYGDEMGAGFAVAELVESGYTNYALTTLACVCVEDCVADKDTISAVMGILNFYKGIYKEKKQKAEYRPALGTVILMLCRSRKSRAGDNYWCVISEKRKRGWLPQAPEFAYDNHVPEEYKTVEQNSRSWRFWVRVSSVLKNKASTDEIGGTDYEDLMNRYWIKGNPEQPGEPDYEFDVDDPYGAIKVKPYVPEDVE